MSEKISIEDVAIGLYLAKVKSHDNCSDSEMQGIYTNGSFRFNSFYNKGASFARLPKDSLPKVGSNVVIAEALFIPDYLKKTEAVDFKLKQTHSPHVMDTLVIVPGEGPLINIDPENVPFLEKYLQPGSVTYKKVGCLWRNISIMYTPEGASEPTEIFDGLTGLRKD